jgi:hypothetical protein
MILSNGQAQALFQIPHNNNIVESGAKGCTNKPEYLINDTPGQ